MGAILGLTLPELRWTAESFLLGLALGPGMAVAATWVPARRAGRRAPLEDLLLKRGDHAEPVRRWPSLVGLGFLGLTVLLVMAIIAGLFSSATAAMFIAPTMALFL